jgi:hypothetical protein
MREFQQEKQAVRDFHTGLDAASLADLNGVLVENMTPESRWHGYHPFNQLIGPTEVCEQFWKPLKRAFSSLQRREDIFFAGRNEMDGFSSVWVVSMGHLMGLFDNHWLGIPPTQKMAFLRYCEFNRVENGHIMETAFFIDIPHLMMQASMHPFPSQTAAHFVQPGPRQHDGLLYHAQDPKIGEKTLATINAMISDLGTWKLGLPLEEELARTWHSDMIWWGPAGIGSTYTIERYAKQHSGPFRAAFSERSSTDHLCRLAEGQFGGFFGYPNFTATLSAPFMGMPQTGKSAEFRVIDIYRRDREKLAENWVFIDLLHFWKQNGWDVLADATGQAYEN